MNSEEKISNEYMSFKDKVLFLSHFITKVFLYVIIVLLLIIFLLIGIYFGNVLHNVNKNDNRPPLFDTYIIVSPSMVPNINVQDGIVIKREKISDIKTGDIITFITHDSRYDGLIITHRVVGIEKMENGSYYYRTKGDANNAVDPYLVKKDDIYGKVIFRVPKVGYIRKYVSNPTGWFIFIVLPAVLVVIYDICKLISHLNSDVVDDNQEEDEELEII